MKQKSVQLGNNYINVRTYDNGAISVEGNFGENGQRVAYAYEDDGRGGQFDEALNHIYSAYSSSVQQIETNLTDVKNFISEVESGSIA